LIEPYTKGHSAKQMEKGQAHDPSARAEKPHVGHSLYRARQALAILAVLAGAAPSGLAAASDPISPTNIFAPDSTPAHSIYRLSVFVLEILGAIFVVVFSLLVYAVIRFRERKHEDGSEPPQIYGSNQMELAWTVLPVLIVVVLFLSTAQVIHRVQDARAPEGTIEVTAVGHQFWWEYRYPQFGLVAANELHVPVSDPTHPTPTYIHLLSSDVDHSFWVPRLAGKTDLIPNHPNDMWIDPHETGLFLGQCAQYCGTQHAKMLLRVYVESREDFDRWVRAQQQQAAANPAAVAGSALFVSKACFVCHTIRGTMAAGQLGPDLTHLMSRDTIGSGAVPNTQENLLKWVHNPDTFKPGTRMPASDLTDQELGQIVAYLMTLN
jgi:cytochrome c oxidase subunit II